MAKQSKYKRLLITGGTGSFGTAFVSKVLKEQLAEEIIVFSRDELKQYEMNLKFNSKSLKFILGDVRDYSRLEQSLDGVEVLIHAAAMKQIPASEDNPMEVIKTNILGAENIVNAAIKNSISNVIALSTDKAANPANLYGATKLCSDKLMISANSLSSNRSTKFGVVRYGNVLGSRGSVIPFFKSQIKHGQITITDPRMTRFWITLEESVQFVLDSLEILQGGEIFVPKIPSFSIVDVANVVAPGIPTEIIGIRPGEKLHEVMITEDDSHNTVEFHNFYAILSPGLQAISASYKNATKVPVGFRYSSENNPNWFTTESFKEMLIKNNLL
jgi:UDP-N-acetylglucosamine 4,6-dehydratase/5-epimerase